MKTETCYYVYDEDKGQEVEFVLETTYSLTPGEKQTRNHPGVSPSVEVLEADVIGVGAGGGTAYFEEPVDAEDYFRVDDLDELMPDPEFFLQDFADKYESRKIDRAEKKMEELRMRELDNH